MILHTDVGDITCRKTLKEVAEKLSGANFAICNSYAIVNLRYITSISGNTVMICGQALPISRRRKPELMERYMNYIGG